MYIAVDFDGTIVEDRYPEIGKERPFATATLRRLMEDGHKPILWSVREGELLREAVEWCERKGVCFISVNKDFDEDDTGSRHYSRKLKADLFIDDRNVGGLPDWGTLYQLITRRTTLENLLEEQYAQERPRKKSWWKF